MKPWQLLLLGTVFGLLAGGLVMLIAAPSQPDPISTFQPTTDPNIIVDVDGYVLHPGMYNLNPGDRIGKAIQAAGGLIDGADTTGINLAAFLSDGQKVLVPGMEGSSAPLPESSPQKTSLINLNTATLEDLVQLPGIGEQKAKAILQYKSSYGNFLSIQDLLYVPGIGQGLLDTIRNYVTVK